MADTSKAFDTAVELFVRSLAPAESFTDDAAALANLEKEKRDELYSFLAVENLAFGYTYVANRLKYAGDGKEAVLASIEQELASRLSVDQAHAQAALDLLRARLEHYAMVKNLTDAFGAAVAGILDRAGANVDAAALDAYVVRVTADLQNLPLEE